MTSKRRRRKDFRGLDSSRDIYTSLILTAIAMAVGAIFLVTWGEATLFIHTFVFSMAGAVAGLIAYLQCCKLINFWPLCPDTDKEWGFFSSFRLLKPSYYLMNGKDLSRALDQYGLAFLGMWERFRDRFPSYDDFKSEVKHEWKQLQRSVPPPPPTHRFANGNADKLMYHCALQQTKDKALIRNIHRHIQSDGDEKPPEKGQTRRMSHKP